MWLKLKPNGLCFEGICVKPQFGESAFSLLASSLMVSILTSYNQVGETFIQFSF